MSGFHSLYLTNFLQWTREKHNFWKSFLIFFRERERKEPNLHSINKRVFFYFSLHSTPFCISFRCTTKCPETHVLYTVAPPASSPHLAHIPMLDITDYIPRAGIHISAAILQLTWRSICSCHLVSMQLLHQRALKCLCGYQSWAIDVFLGCTVPYSAMGRWGPRQKAVTTGIFLTC